MAIRFSAGLGELMSIIGLWQRKIGFGDRTSLGVAIRFCIGPRTSFGRLPCACQASNGGKHTEPRWGAFRTTTDATGNQLRVARTLWLHQMGDPSSPAKRNVDPVRVLLACDVMKECVTLGNV